MSQDIRATLIPYLNIPQVSEFLDAVDAMWPERTPSTTDEMIDIYVQIGRRDVVRTLLSLRAEARENMLETVKHVPRP